MPKDTLNKIVENLSKLSVSEAAELSKLLEEKWGVEANAPIVAVAPQPSANGESQDELGDGGVVNIELIAAGDKKIDVISYRSKFLHTLKQSDYTFDPDFVGVNIDTRTSFKTVENGNRNVSMISNAFTVVHLFLLSLELE